MIGAYSAIAEVLATVGIDIDRLVERRPFELSYPDGFRITASRLPAPWHLVTALLGARGLAWRDRWSMTRLLRALEADRWQVAAGSRCRELARRARTG